MDDDLDTTDRGISRRNVLKGTTAAGVVGASAGLLPGQARAHPKPRTIVIKALTAPAKYTFTVSGEVAKGPRSGSTDVVKDSNTVVGRIDTKGEIDDFRFSGKLTSFKTLEGAVDVVVDDKAVKSDRPEPKPLPNTIAIQANGPGVSYQFRVTGRVEKGPQADDEGDVVVDGTKVRGTVGGQGVDDYRYSGSLVFDSTEGPLTVTIELDQP